MTEDQTVERAEGGSEEVQETRLKIPFPPGHDDKPQPGDRDYTVDPRWFIEPFLRDGGVAISFRHAQHGWLHFVLPPAQAAKVSYYVSHCIAAVPPPPPAPPPNRAERRVQPKKRNR